MEGAQQTGGPAASSGPRGQPASPMRKVCANHGACAVKSLTIAVIPWLLPDQPVTLETVLRRLPPIVLMDGYELAVRFESDRIMVEFREVVTECGAST